MRLWAWGGPRSPWHRLLEWSGRWEQSVNLGLRSGASVSPPVEWVWEWMPGLVRALERGHSDSNPALEGTQLGREATVGRCGRRWEVAHVGEGGRGAAYRIQWAAQSPSQPGGVEVGEQELSRGGG